MSDRIAWTPKHVIGALFGLSIRLATDFCDVVCRKRRFFARHCTHVALLASHAPFGGWARAVLSMNDFQPDSRVHSNLVARDADVASLKRCKEVCAAVHVLAWAFFARIQFEFMLLCAGNRRSYASSVASSVHRLVNVAWFDSAVAIAAPVVFVDAVARDAGDAFAYDRRSIQHTHFARQ